MLERTEYQVGKKNIILDTCMEYEEVVGGWRLFLVVWKTTNVV